VLIAEIRVDGNEAAPLYRLPHAGVRIVGTLVGRGGLEPPPFMRLRARTRSSNPSGVARHASRP
jgi:hypothetical protein